MFKPWRTLLFLLGVVALCMALGLMFPREGIRVTDKLTLRFPSPTDLIGPNGNEAVDISDIAALATDAPEDIVPADTLPEDTSAVQLFVFDTTRIPPLHERIVLHYPDNDRTVLYPLFAALEGARNAARPVHIMHYGDSQLESDRITSYIRNKLQHQFGGSGPGLVSIADIVPHFSIDRTLSPNWKRYSVMGRRDPAQDHQRFGALSSFSRFTPLLAAGALPDTTVHTGWVKFGRAQHAYARAQSWTECRLYYGWNKGPVALELEADGADVSAEVVPAGSELKVREWRFPTTPTELTLTFSGQDGPDVFGVSLEGHAGVNVDNIPARGGAGYEFNNMDQGLLRRMYADLDVRAFILQFGGNVVPEIESKEGAEAYGEMFGQQIARFKRMVPDACIIVIGPSDMSIREGEHMVTRPFLEEVRDALKANTLAQGAVFWDMYHAMGGRGSMVSWVEATPALAVTDYTHFSPQGARKVGELFYTAFINDFAEYHRHKE